MTLRLRTLVETPEGSDEWRENIRETEFAPSETAFLICDMWDRHWCRSANRRCDALAHKMAPVLDAARALGVQILHAPSECMDFYEGAPQRQRMRNAPRAEPPQSPLAIAEPPLPIDDSDGGCDDDPPCPVYRAWTREHPALRIAEEDGISDDGDEVYNRLRERGITNLLVAGVHTNLCVLKRSFALRAMIRRGVACALVRDLTDSLYNPRMRPFVTHDEGTDLVVRHIEKTVCPTILSEDLLR